MNKINRNKWIIQRTAEDSCLICGVHGNYGGGHSFKGRKFIEGYNEEDILIDKYNWIYICGFQFCPTCFEKVYNNWKKEFDYEIKK